MPETAEPAAESFDTAQLDALLEQMGGPIPKDTAAEVAPAAPPPAMPAAPPAKPAETPAKPEEPPAKPPEPPAKVDDPLVPPPSVLGEVPEIPVVDDVDKEFGNIPEKPARGFKDKTEEGQWHSVRESHEKLKKELRGMRETASKAGPDPAAAAQIAELTERVNQLNSIVERKAIEEHPWVLEKFQRPREAEITRAKRALELVDVEPKEFTRLLNLQGKDRKEALDELIDKVDSPSTQKRLVDAIEKIDEIDSEKDVFLQDRQANAAKLTQAEQAETWRRAAEEEKMIETTIAQTVDFLANNKGFVFLRKSNEPGYEKWNTRVDDRVALINELALKNKNPQRFITALSLGAVAPDILQAWQSERTGRLAAEKKVAEYEGTLPGKASVGKPDVAKVTGDPDLDAAGVLPEDDLAAMSRKLGAFYSSR